MITCEWQNVMSFNIKQTDIIAFKNKQYVFSTDLYKKIKSIL